MRSLVVLLLSGGLVWSGCGGEPAALDDQSSADAIAAALDHLVATDHTFGSGPPPFSTYSILEATDPRAVPPGSAGAQRPLTEAERHEVEQAISVYGDVLWVSSDPTSLPTVGPDHAWLSASEPEVIDGETVRIRVSLVCGNLCATSADYVLVDDGSTWAVERVENRTIS